MANSKVDQIAQRAEVQLSHETGSMSFHRSNANVQSRADLLIGFAFRQQLQDLQLASRESDSKIGRVAALDQCDGLKRAERLAAR